MEVLLRNIPQILLSSKVHSQLEELFIKSAKRSDYQSEYEFVTGFYGSDFNRGCPRTVIIYGLLNLLYVHD